MIILSGNVFQHVLPQKCCCPLVRFFLLNTSRVIGGLAVGHEIWFGWLERILSPFCKTLKGINHTKANDASVIFQRITLLFVSQATLKVRKCLLNQ